MVELVKIVTNGLVITHRLILLIMDHDGAKKVALVYQLPKDKILLKALVIEIDGENQNHRQDFGGQIFLVLKKSKKNER
jgi:hypothetical protein